MIQPAHGGTPEVLAVNPPLLMDITDLGPMAFSAIDVCAVKVRSRGASPNSLLRPHSGATHPTPGPVKFDALSSGGQLDQ